MRRVNRGWALALAALALAFASCTNNSVDDGGGPNVLLQILSVENPVVTASNQEDGICTGDGVTPCSDITDCTLAGGSCVGASCTLEVQEWTITLGNAPKTDLAQASPYNDVVITNITLSYSWGNGFSNSPISYPTSIVIPANGTGQLTFFPMTNEDLTALVGFLGVGTPATGTISIQINGTVVDSDSISVTAGEQLFIESCF